MARLTGPGPHYAPGLVSPGALEGADGYLRWSRADFARPTLELAPALIGAYLFYRGRIVRITETEAYQGELDPASHAYRGRTPRTAPMFGPPGHLYVYFTYGMHNCINVIGDGRGVASGILLRAGEVMALGSLGGVPVLVRDARVNSEARTSAVGPGRLGRFVGATTADSSFDLCRQDSDIFVFCLSDYRRRAKPGISSRIGVKQGAQSPWRYFDPASSWVYRHPRPLAAHAQALSQDDGST